MTVNPNDPQELATTAVMVIRTHAHMVLGTADSSGRPWAVPVSPVTLPDGRITWISAIATRHSQNIAVNHQTSGVFYSATAENGEISLFLEGEAASIEDATELQAILDARAVVKAKPQPPTAGFLGDAEYRIYSFMPTAVWINDDTHTKTELDLQLLLTTLKNYQPTNPQA